MEGFLLLKEKLAKLPVKKLVKLGIASLYKTGFMLAIYYLFKVHYMLAFLASLGLGGLNSYFVTRKYFMDGINPKYSMLRGTVLFAISYFSKLLIGMILAISLLISEKILPIVVLLLNMPISVFGTRKWVFELDELKEDTE